MAECIRAVFVDLDHTLLDHETTLQAVAAALDAEFPLSHDCLSPGATYLQLLDWWEPLSRLGLPSIRRRWLHPRTIANVLAICDRSTRPDIYPSWITVSAGIAESTGSWPPDFVPRLLSKTASLWRDSDTRGRIGAFVERVGRSDEIYHSFHDADAFLATLADTSLLTYVVTEGSGVVQHGKYTGLGLDKWIAPNMFLTSDDFHRPPELTVARSLLSMVEVQLQLRESSPHIFHRPTERTLERQAYLSEQIERALGDASSLERIAALGRLHRALAGLIAFLSSARLKSHPSFYRFLLHSLWRQPRDPRLGFRSVFAGLPLPDRELRLAVVGDRYDTDLYPLLSVFGQGVITVRLRRGRHLQTYLPDELEHLGVPSPTLSCDGLEEAARFLTDQDSWSGIEPLEPPALVPEADGNLRDSLRACLVFPEGSVPRKVATAALMC